MPDPQDRYIIDKLMPTRRIHLLGGPSGAGKTTYVLQLLSDWRKGRAIWGYASYPGPLLYICCDRTEEGLRETIERVDPTLSDIPIYSMIDHNDCMSMLSVFQIAPRIVPGVKLIVCDGVTRLIRNGNDYYEVANGLSEGTRASCQINATLLGIGHSSKTKENERYLNPRQRLWGSVAWAAYSDAIVLVEPVAAEDPIDQRRTVTVLPRNAAEMTFHYRRNQQGCFVDAVDEMDQCILDLFIQRQTCEAEITKSQMVAACPNTPERTVESWITARVEQNVLRRIRPGLYKRTQTV